MLIDDVEQVIRRSPGLTARQIATALFGIYSYQERVGATCVSLCDTGRIERHGAGGPGRPFTYYPAVVPGIAATGRASLLQRATHGSG
jgi:hypothetical protein